MIPPRAATWLLAVYAVAVLAVVFQPFPGAANDSIDLTHRIAAKIGASWLSPNDVQFGLNIVLFAPLTFLGSLIFRRLSWVAWTGLGLLGSTAIELVQWAFLPDRTASLSDVASNTMGAFVGAVLAGALLTRRHSREQQRAVVG